MHDGPVNAPVTRSAQPPPRFRPRLRTADRRIRPVPGGFDRETATGKDVFDIRGDGGEIAVSRETAQRRCPAF
ncbi:hypothetical protein [Streptomyces sp. NPDC001530]|uniref:hypothetical protein n=1 Tax=Streptomyces sp. NPDC001530 TaxID=3364582 RepID=UPI0036AD8800